MKFILLIPSAALLMIAAQPSQASEICETRAALMFDSARDKSSKDISSQRKSFIESCERQGRSQMRMGAQNEN